MKRGVQGGGKIDPKSAEVLESITPQEMERIIRELDKQQTKGFLKGSVDIMEVHARLCSARELTPREASRLFPQMKPLIMSTVEGIKGLEYVEYSCCQSDFIYIRNT